MDHNISQLALDSGLTHLGQFATDYKRLFRESPSATRNRARARYRGTPGLRLHRSNAVTA
jgi:AraC-like DNA-binding protein